MLAAVNYTKDDMFVMYYRAKNHICNPKSYLVFSIKLKVKKISHGRHVVIFYSTRKLKRKLHSSLPSATAYHMYYLKNHHQLVPLVLSLPHQRSENLLLLLSLTLQIKRSCEDLKLRNVHTKVRKNQAKGLNIEVELEIRTLTPFDTLWFLHTGYR